ncbi:unnamed protein product [Closterium sp. NIES-64]|nr:unnamed protein product [Closterium sp. NIES-64]
MYLLQRDLLASHKVLTEQAEGYNAAVEARLARLENLTASLADAHSHTHQAAAE